MPIRSPATRTDTELSASREPPRYEFAGLDLLRLVACLSVLLYHYSFRGAAGDGLSTFSVPSMQFASKYGFFGVDVFFIISGFVIAYSAAGRSARHFFISRFVRLYPAFIVCMPLSFIVAFLYGAPEIKVTLPQLAPNTIIVAPLLHQSFVDGAYWSIVCEIVFYAWIMSFVYLGMIDRHTIAIVAVWLGLSALNETVFHSTALTWAFLTKYSGFFAIGVMLYNGRFHGWSASALAVMAGAIVLAHFQLLGDIGYHNTHYAGVRFDPVIAVAMCSASIACIAAIVLLERCRRRPRLVLVAGGVTYPLYLLHQNIGYTIFNRVKSDWSPELLLIVVAGALVLCAWVIWRFVEKPAQRVLKSVLLRPGEAPRTSREGGRWLGRAYDLGVSRNLQ